MTFRDKTCEHCGETYTPTSGYSKYCPQHRGYVPEGVCRVDGCGEPAYSRGRAICREHRKQQRAPRVTKSCSLGDECVGPGTFETTRDGTRMYCSDPCSQRAHYYRVQGGFPAAVTESCWLGDECVGPGTFEVAGRSRRMYCSERCKQRASRLRTEQPSRAKPKVVRACALGDRCVGPGTFEATNLSLKAYCCAGCTEIALDDRMKINTAKTCALEGCTEPRSRTYRLCGRHLRNKQRRGDPLADPPPKLGRPQKDVVAYTGAHARVRAARGPAELYPCADGCGRQAEQWAYDHRDPDELLGRAVGANVNPLAYSLKPEHYRPLCRACHSREEAEYRGWLIAKARERQRRTRRVEVADQLPLFDLDVS